MDFGKSVPLLLDWLILGGHQIKSAFIGKFDFNTTRLDLEHIIQAGLEDGVVSKVILPNIEFHFIPAMNAKAIWHLSLWFNPLDDGTGHVFLYPYNVSMNHTTALSLSASSSSSSNS